MSLILLHTSQPVLSYTPIIGIFLNLRCLIILPPNEVKLLNSSTDMKKMTLKYGYLLKPRSQL